jgi:hypothetical protein
VIFLKNKFLYTFLFIFFIAISIYLLYSDPGHYRIVFNKEITSSDIDKYDVFVSSYHIYNTRELNNNSLSIETNKIGYWLIISRDDVVTHKSVPFGIFADKKF